MKNLKLSNGKEIPQIGFGVYRMDDPVACEKTVAEAIQDGYRLFDTAAAYGNEKAVGEAIRKSGIDRSEFFITSKLWVSDYENPERGIERSLENLGTDTIDLYLLHQPVGDVYSAWRGLEKGYREGKLKAIGVSNFYPDRLEDLIMHADIMPMVNQVELHPFFQQNRAVAMMQKNGIIPMAWGPLAEGSHGIFKDQTLSQIGEAHGKSAAQVALRWNLERGAVVIPGSGKPEHMKEDMDILDFSLTDAEKDEIRTLNHDHSDIIDHRNPSVVRMLCRYHLPEKEETK